MPSDSIISSSLSEQRWVNQMITIFQKKHILEMDTPACVFRVPKCLSETKPEAYAPQVVGLGPCHHFRPELYLMERQKIAAIQRLLMPEEFQNLEALVVDKLKEVEPTIRSCYDKYLDFDCDTLAWVLAIDGIYLLSTLTTYPQETMDLGDFVDSGQRRLAQDLLMLETQIPAILLREIRKALRCLLDSCPIKPVPLRNNLRVSDYFEINDTLLFCRAHSPHKISEQKIHHHHISAGVHLLARLYYLIVNNRGIQEVRYLPKIKQELVSISVNEVEDRCSTALEIADTATRVLDTGGLEKHVSFLKSLPWKRILEQFKNMISQTDESECSVEEIDIPSVSQLKEIAKIDFKITGGGIRDVSYDADNSTFYLPEITLNTDSEIILRNWVAYEAAVAPPGSSSSPEFAEYVDLMCGIVDTPKDVDLLRKEGIIQGGLSDEETANLFNGIRRSAGKSPENKSSLEASVDKVNVKFGSTGKVKTYKILKKHVYHSWKFLTFLSTVVLLSLIALQS